MSVEQDLKQQLERVTDHVVGGPRLETSLRAGRRTRRRRSLAYAAGSLATAGTYSVDGVSGDPARIVTGTGGYVVRVGGTAEGQPGRHSGRAARRPAG